MGRGSGTPAHRKKATPRAAERKRWLASSDGVCGFCGGTGSDTVDHVTPLALGGEDTPANWRPAHRSCNSRAGATVGNRIRGAQRQRRKRLEAIEGSSPATDDDADRPVLRPMPNPARHSARNTPGVRGGASNRADSGIDRRKKPAPVSGARSVPATPVKPRQRDGLTLPRLATPQPRGVRSIGPEAIDWIHGSGILPGDANLRAWQAYALRRALEVRDGRLRWPVVVLTTSRQSGKSWLLRAAAWWRMHQGARFGEAQTVLHVANKERTAREVWRPAARHAVEVYGKPAAKFGAGREEIELPSGSRWLVQAATQNAGVGYSLSMAIVDEAWNVDRGVVEDAITPAMAEREQPQLWLVSTAGDSGSDLLRAYREQALQDRTGSGGILLLEWSAPPEAPYDAESTWRWASPEWSPRRLEFLRGRVATVAEPVFRTQYLNQWVQAVDGWVPASVWALGFDEQEPPAAQPDAVAVEVSPNGERFGAVAAWWVGDQIVVRSFISLSSSTLWRQVEAWKPRVLLLPPSLMVHYTGRQRAVQVGVQEVQRHLGGVARAIAEGKVRHSPTDQNLNDHVGRAVAVQTDSGARLSTTRSTGPIEAARAMVWAVGELLRPAQPRPKVRAAL